MNTTRWEGRCPREKLLVIDMMIQKGIACQPTGDSTSGSADTEHPGLDVNGKGRTINVGDVTAVGSQSS
jgi:hypothetical protein